MRLDIISFTPGGYALAERIKSALVEGHEIHCHHDFPSVRALVSELFSVTDGLIFIGATGIAVRAIAPHLKSKLKDPAVICCDEGGGFVISLLSGHWGGANELAREISGKIGAQPVITTATDVKGVFAADTWAKANDFYIENPENIKSVSGALLRGEPVSLYSQYPVEGKLPAGIYISEDIPADALILRPKNLVVGIGCRRGTSKDSILKAIESAGVSISDVCKIASIDLKKDEAGLLELGREYKIPLEFYTADELNAAEGDFPPSDFVQGITGTDNVCQRAAVLAGGEGELILGKTKYDGVTVAIFKRRTRVKFYD